MSLPFLKASCEDKRGFFDFIHIESRYFFLFTRLRCARITFSSFLSSARKKCSNYGFTTTALARTSLMYVVVGPRSWAGEEREGGTVTDGQGGFAPKLAPSSSLFARCVWHIVAKKRRDTWHIFAFSQERKEKARKIERGGIFWKGPCVPFLKLDFAKSVNYTLLSRNGTRHYGFRGGGGQENVHQHHRGTRAK